MGAKQAEIAAASKPISFVSGMWQFLSPARCVAERDIARACSRRDFLHHTLRWNSGQQKSWRRPRNRMPAYIQARDVNLTFRPPNRGPVRALQRFDLDVNEGEFLSILGPSGCGKSTFLNVL